MRKAYRSSTAVAMTALAIAATLGAAAPAQAARSENLIIGKHQNLGGPNWQYRLSNENLGGPGDEASSVFNDTAVAWVLYDDAGFQDRRYCIYPDQLINDLHDSRWRFGDKISSVKRLGGASCAGYPTF